MAVNIVWHGYLCNNIYCGIYYMSRDARKPDICLCENIGADQLRGNREADQRLCFRYTDSIFPLLLISEISSFLPASVTVQVSLCQTLSETPKTGFLASRLILCLLPGDARKSITQLTEYVSIMCIRRKYEN